MRYISMKKIYGLLITLLVTSFLSILSLNNSPNHDEAANIVGGLSIWKYGRFDLYNVNPPLVRLTASLPIALFCDPDIDWKIFQDHIDSDKVGNRPEFSMGLDFIRRNTQQANLHFFIARLACLPFFFIGAYFVWRWSSELYGYSAGLCSLTLWCFCPNILTWGSMVMPDLSAASFGVMAGYFFWKWLQVPEKGNAFIAGISLGLALLTKLTWILLIPLFPLLWLVWYFFKTEQRSWRIWKTQIIQLAILLVTGFFVLNLGYGFEGTCTKLSDYRFASKTLAGKDSIVDGQRGGNRFKDTTLATFPVPLPKNYVVGADLQKVDFEKGLPSYLNGNWSGRGWWYFYLECALLKIPLGTWGLGILAVVFSLPILRSRAICDLATTSKLKERKINWGDEFILLVPAVVLVIFVSSQTGFSRHFRYVLPAFPFIYVWISKIIVIAVSKGRVFKAVVMSLLAWSIISTLFVFPHYMSYFNELAGGPKNGHYYLLDSSIDWGQDVYYLKKWIKEHPEAKGLHLLLRDDISDAFFYSDNYPKVPPTSGEPINTNVEEDYDLRLLGPRPGWFAASIHQIHAEHGRYKYLLDLDPVAKIGYSFYIYCISIADANRLRQTSNLLPIKAHPENKFNFLENFIISSSDKRDLRIALFYSDNHDNNVTKDIERILYSNSMVTWQPVYAWEIRSGVLNDFDVVIFPGGSGFEQGKSLGIKGKIAVRDFVENGGGYLGICAGAFLASTNDDYGLALVNLKSNIGHHYIKNEGFISQSIHGAGLVDLTLTNDGINALKIDSLPQIQYSSGPVFIPAYRQDIPDFISLANYSTDIAAYDYQKGIMQNTPAIILAPYGKGKVLISGVHIETASELEGLFKNMIFGLTPDEANRVRREMGLPELDEVGDE